MKPLSGKSKAKVLIKERKKIVSVRKYIDTTNSPTTSYCHTKDNFFFLETQNLSQTETKLISINELTSPG